MSGFTIFLIVCVALALLYGYLSSKAQENAKAAYQQALLELKGNPTNPDIKQKALTLGRAYSNLTRDNKGQTVFDEVALMNDINAACAAAVVSDQAGVHIGRSLEERLQRLTELHSKGLISEAEFHKQRESIIKSI